MIAAPILAAPDRFALIIDGLCRMITRPPSAGLAPRPLALAPLVGLVLTRLRRLGVRFARLAARVSAGTASVRPRTEPRAALPRSPSPVAPRLPRGFAWLLRLAPEAAAFGSQLQYLLSDPEMAALVSAAPQMGRVLRPLYRMLGVDCSPELRLPRRVAATCRDVPVPRAPVEAAFAVPVPDPKPGVPRSTDHPEAAASDLAAVCFARI